MPLYKAYKNSNTRETAFCEFEGPDDETAEAYRLAQHEACALEWEYCTNSMRDADVSDETLDLDRIEPSVGEHGAALQDTQLVTAEEVISLAWERLYVPESERVVRRVAALADVGAFMDAVSTLDRLIHEARALVH